MSQLRSLALLLMIVSLSIGIGVSAHQPTEQATIVSNQNLPPSDWWVVTHVFDENNDTLHWINANGEQASMERPKLPNENEEEQIARVLLTHDGATLIIAANLADNTQGLGFYDIETGTFFNFHVSQPNEFINLGGRYSIRTDSQRIAIGFTTPPWNNNNVAEWRVIVFDLTTGDPLHILEDTGPELQNFVGGEQFISQLYTPFVVYYDVDGTADSIHIQYILWGEPPYVNPSLNWYPDGVPGLSQNLLGTPYNLAGMDFNMLTDEALFVDVDPNKPTQAGTGLFRDYNAISRGSPGNVSGYPGPTIVHSDGDAFYYSARWGADGSMIMFGGGTQTQPDNYFYMRMGGGVVELGPNVYNSMGIPPGFVWLHDANGSLQLGVHYADNSVHNPALWVSPSPNATRLVWASIGRIQFGLTQIGTTRPITPGTSGNAGNSGNAPGQGNNNGQGNAFTCQGAPPARLEVGMNARVTFTDGRPLNVRQTPNGTQVLQIEEGTEMSIIGGPQCSGGYVWWQMRTTTNVATEGWVAEGELGSYYIEPFNNANGNSNNNNSGGRG